MKFLPLLLLLITAQAQAGLTCSDYLADPVPEKIASYLSKDVREPVRYKPLAILDNRITDSCTRHPDNSLHEVLRYIEYLSDISWHNGNGWILYSADVKPEPEQG